MGKQTKIRPKKKDLQSKSKESRQQALAKLIAKIIIRISFKEFYGKGDKIDNTDH